MAALPADTGGLASPFVWPAPLPGTRGTATAGDGTDACDVYNNGEYFLIPQIALTVSELYKYSLEG